MLVGYIRVSTEEQNTGRQEEMLKNYTFKNEKIEEYFIEKMSGKNTEREQLNKMLGFVRKGDIIVIESLSRLTRSIRDLLKIADKLKEKDVSLVSLKENFDTTTANGKFMFGMFGVMSEFERDNILERQKEGIALAKAEGKYKGRKKIEVDKKQFENIYKEWKNGAITAVQAHKKLNLNPRTFYRRVAEYEKQI